MALKGALDLELFTHIADGATSAAEMRQRSKASERGVRILCDYMVVHGFLTKHEGAYGLTPNRPRFSTGVRGVYGRDGEFPFVRYATPQF